MTELGTVTEIKDRLLSVQLEENEGCAACSNSSCKDKRQSIKVYNRDGLDIREGDRVEVEVQGRAQLSGAFLPVLAQASLAAYSRLSRWNCSFSCL